MKFLFSGTTGCHSVLSIAGIIEGSRCHSWSEQYLLSSFEITVLRGYWEFRAVIWTQIRTRVLFLLAETSGWHSVLSIAGIIGGPRCHSWSEQYLLFSFERTLCVTIGGSELYFRQKSELGCGFCCPGICGAVLSSRSQELSRDRCVIREATDDKFMFLK